MECRAPPNTSSPPLLQNLAREPRDRHPPALPAPVAVLIPRGWFVLRGRTPRCPDGKNIRARRCSSIAAPKWNRSGTQHPPALPPPLLTSSPPPRTPPQSAP